MAYITRTIRDQMKQKEINHRKQSKPGKRFVGPSKGVSVLLTKIV